MPQPQRHGLRVGAGDLVRVDVAIPLALVRRLAVSAALFVEHFPSTLARGYIGLHLQRRRPKFYHDAAYMVPQSTPDGCVPLEQASTHPVAVEVAASVLATVVEQIVGDIKQALLIMAATDGISVHNEVAEVLLHELSCLGRWRTAGNAFIVEWHWG